MLTLRPRVMPTRRERSMNRLGQGGARDQSKLALTLLAPQHERHRMSNDLRALPRDTPDYHSRQAAHLRALAESTTTARLKARLLKTPNSTKSSPLWRMKRQSARLSVETRRAVPARSAADIAAESIALAQLAAECPSWIGRQLRAHAAGRRGCSRLRAGAIKRK
jgi:hypothetical protein